MLLSDHLNNTNSYKVWVETTDDSKQCYVQCTYWANKGPIKVGPQYSRGFSDKEILNEVDGQLSQMAGYRQVIRWEPKC